LLLLKLCEKWKSRRDFQGRFLRRKQAQFRDPQVTLDNFDFNFNKKMNRSLDFDLATATFIARREDGLFLGPPDPDAYCYTSLSF
jgi:DNA replication protein DnaC